MLIICWIILKSPICKKKTLFNHILSSAERLTAGHLNEVHASIKTLDIPKSKSAECALSWAALIQKAKHASSHVHQQRRAGHQLHYLFTAGWKRGIYNLQTRYKALTHAVIVEGNFQLAFTEHKRPLLSFSHGWHRPVSGFPSRLWFIIAKRNTELRRKLPKERVSCCDEVVLRCSIPVWPEFGCHISLYKTARVNLTPWTFLLSRAALQQTGLTPAPAM